MTTLVTKLTMLAALLALAQPAAAQSTSAAGGLRGGPAAARPATAPAPAAAPAAGTAAAGIRQAPASAAAAGATFEQVMAADDAAIVNVGGREVRAGDIKREVWSALKAASGSPPPTQVLRPIPGSRIPESAIGTAAAGAASGSVAAERVLKGCSDLQPGISRIEGKVTPGGTFTLYGACFGERPGAVELIGVAASPQRALFQSWSNGKIVASLPRVSGVSDAAVAVSVVTHDGQRSPARQAQFVAERQSVAIPEHRIRPARLYESPRKGAGLATSSTPGNSGTTRVDVGVHPSCAIESVQAHTEVGSGTLGAWIEKTPFAQNEASIDFRWSRSCTTTITTIAKGLYASDAHHVCALGIRFTGTALCPVGVQP